MGNTALKRAALFVASGFGVGRIPLAPGTFGSLLGLPIVWLIRPLPEVTQWGLAAGLSLLAVWVASATEDFLGKKDPGVVVIDEVVGMMVTLIGLPFEWSIVVAGFVMFRIFDIWKPGLIRICQDRLPGGWGIVLDDLAAGLVANGILRVAGVAIPLLP